ncbi:tetratricopeptide repeat protein, partial [Rodentibacter genomosp. 1]|uniref:tetratricopeptide repeat protein n=1 Tax=Rodentibacter genomosp. 1 TaxID=1908264 RepID=UPI00117AB34A
KSAEQGHANAQFNLGLMYEKGRGVKQDYIQAKKWYEKASEQKHAAATTNLGYLYENGYGTRQDKYKARELYGKGCDLGNQIGCNNYNNMKGMFLFESAESLSERWEKEREEASEREKEWKKRMIEDGKADFEAMLAKVEKDPKDTEALYQIGDYYNRGWGIAKNKSKAVEFMTKAAERNDKKAQYWLGSYWLGWDVQYNVAYGYDIAKGIDYLTQAAKQNHSEAQNVLGLQYLNGVTVRQDLYKAKGLFGQACDNGNMEGCQNYKDERLQNLPNPFEKIFGEYWAAILGGLGALMLTLIAFLLGKRSKNKKEN